mmetsp:Transcript_84594/g.226079  ORF Transcript_84594/g.226079 Transcript_84594/m.226079 type:complete len:250 (+) Transcript_84594:1839-2588(+)
MTSRAVCILRMGRDRPIANTLPQDGEGIVGVHAVHHELPCHIEALMFTPPELQTLVPHWAQQITNLFIVDFHERRSYSVLYRATSRITLRLLTNFMEKCPHAARNQAVRGSRRRVGRRFQEEVFCSCHCVGLATSGLTVRQNCCRITLQRCLKQINHTTVRKNLFLGTVRGITTAKPKFPCAADPSAVDNHGGVGHVAATTLPFLELVRQHRTHPHTQPHWHRGIVPNATWQAALGSTHRLRKEQQRHR